MSQALGQVIASQRVDGVPTAIRHDSKGAMWVITQQGRVYKNGLLLLDISAKMPRFTLGDERGLIALALHPIIPNKYYLLYAATGSKKETRHEAPDHGEETEWHEHGYKALWVLEEYIGQMYQRTLLEIKKPGLAHNGKDTLAFRSDGRLVWATGDGGINLDPYNLAQSPEFLHGKVLSIDVDTTHTVGPIARVSELPAGVVVEAKGLRNPVGVQFVMVDNKEYLVLPVAGQSKWEWVEILPANARGLNFGWRTYEGPERTVGQFGQPVNKKDPDFPYYKPVLAYTHQQVPSFLATVIVSARLIGPYLYALDYGGGLLRAKPNFANLQQNVPFEKIKLPVDLDRWTTLGQVGASLIVAGVRKGQGYVYTINL